MDKCLHAFTRLAQQWAKRSKLDLYIKPLTSASLFKENAYPELSSRVKASRARVLLGFCSHYVQHLAKAHGASPDASLRARMVRNLDAAISIFGMADRPHMDPHDTVLGCKRLNKFLLAYQVLAATALQRQQLIWKLRPKHHYLCHLISETEQTGLNPMHMSNFLDEDHMKHLRAIVHSCHPAKVLTSWSKRYLLKKCFLLRRYTYSPQA